MKLVTNCFHFWCKKLHFCTLNYLTLLTMSSLWFVSGKMDETLTSPLYAMLCIAITGIASAAISFTYVFLKLKINHVIKKLLLFGTAQQAVGYGVIASSIVVSFIQGFISKLTCIFGFISFAASILGSQSVVTMISVIR